MGEAAGSSVLSEAIGLIVFIRNGGVTVGGKIEGVAAWDSVDEAFVDSLVSFIDPLTVTAGIITEEGVVIAVTECSNMVNRDEEIAKTAGVVVGEVLGCSIVKRDGGIDDSILDFKITEGMIDSGSDFVTTIFVVTVFPITVT